jgi:hypothetical protein
MNDDVIDLGGLRPEEGSRSVDTITFHQKIGAEDNENTAWRELMLASTKSYGKQRFNANEKELVMNKQDSEGQVLFLLYALYMRKEE